MNGILDKNSKIYIFGSDDIAYSFEKILLTEGYKCYVKNIKEFESDITTGDEYFFIFAKDTEEEYIIKKELLRKYKKYISCITNGERLETVNKMLRVSGFCNKEMAMIHNPLDDVKSNMNINELITLFLEDMKNYVPKPLDKNLKG